MKATLVIATNNRHKLEEIRSMTGDAFHFKTLEEIGCTEDIPETANTFYGNASLKSFHVFNTYGLNCFADDSGLEVEALNGEPGVYSARYAGEQGNHEANIDLLLQRMEGQTNRRANFRTVISLVIDGEEHFFEGTVYGTLRGERSGSKGFGYDPVFQPDGHDITFAEMDPEQKNAISHRGIAMQKLVTFLQGYRS